MQGCMIITERVGRVDHILPKMQIKPQMSRAGWGKWIRKMELKKSHRCEGATTGRQTHTFEHLAVRKTPSRGFALWDPAISWASAWAGRRHGLRGATYMWRGRTSKGRVRVCAKTEPLSPTRTMPDASTL